MAQPQQKGLGKGLSALMSEAGVMPQAAPNIPDMNAIRVEGLSLLPPEKLIPGAYQPRRNFSENELLELTASIEKNGIMQPIVVRAVAGGAYEIIAGERRWRAAKLAKLKTVPVIIREVSNTQALELALIENIQRADLNPLEEAAGYQRLIKEFSHTQEKLASIVGKSRSHVANLLRLLELPESIKNYIDSGELTMGHARALLTAKNPESLAAEVVRKGLSVRQTEELAKGGDASAKAPKTPKEPASAHSTDKNQDVLQIEELLSQNLGLKVSINTKNAQAGEVVISYENLVQLDEVLRRLGGGV